MLAEEFDVVGTAFNGVQLLAEAARLSPEVLIVDIGMPGLSGIEAVQRLSDLQLRIDWLSAGR